MTGSGGRGTATVGGDVELLQELAEARRDLEQQVARRIVGQKDIVEKLLIALLAGGHALVVGVPGLAKTTLISTLADTLRLRFSRIQFTPDLMPSDITGTEVLEEDAETGQRVFRFVPGPVFANVILADEINRTPPKTQAALLQAMQELSVTVGTDTFVLEPPFFVLATQNPIEHEGTYPLPEAQLDRFMLELRITYPTYDEEREVAAITTSADPAKVEPVIDGERLREFQSLIRRVPAPPTVVEQPVPVSLAVGSPAVAVTFPVLIMTSLSAPLSIPVACATAVTAESTSAAPASATATEVACASLRAVVLIAATFSTRSLPAPVLIPVPRPSAVLALSSNAAPASVALTETPLAVATPVLIKVASLRT